jgi:hypothetical protein
LSRSIIGSCFNLAFKYIKKGWKHTLRVLNFSVITHSF